jgi:hypothetical protein
MTRPHKPTLTDKIAAWRLAFLAVSGEMEATTRAELDRWRETYPDIRATVSVGAPHAAQVAAALVSGADLTEE